MTRFPIALPAFVSALLLACSSGHKPAVPATSGTPGTNGMRLSSSAFTEDGTIPARFTCAGDNVSPPLQIAGVPAGAKSLALIVDDPDGPGGDFIHWTVWNIDAKTTTLIQGGLPVNAVQGVNGFSRAGYAGPCPPAGSSHRYRFTLYALPQPLTLAPSAGIAAVQAAIDNAHPLAVTTLQGRFGR